MVVHRLLRGRLARNTSLSLLWQLARVGAQALWLLALARKIGPDGYGTFAGVAGLATFLGAFSGLGLGLLLLRAVARDPSLLGAYWHKGIRWTIGSGIAIALAFLAISLAAARNDASLPALLAIGASEVVLFPLVSLCAFAFNAHERSGFAAGLPALTALIRLVGVTIFLVSPLPATIATYSFVHLATTLVAASAAVAITQTILRPGPAVGRVTRSELVDGAGYSTVWAVTNALGSLDKTLVLHLAGGTVAGLYASAYRLTMVFTLPIDALAMSSLPRVFRHDSDPAAGRRLVGRMFVVGLGFSLVAALLLHLSAGILPWLLGPSFAGAVSAARTLVWLLPAYSLRLLGSNTLLGLDGQWLRLAIESLGVLLLCLTAWWFVSLGGLQGSARMIVTTEGCLALLTWCVVGWRLRARS
ncbi:oligosaccharide flippase family protein [Luteibacter aegosomatis]|uniref:oligosaccharide flippase family protein n=1 Tax=Luteibacter aegosomatis TaxID=2911537 RepID=UPI001FF9E361|nr:oligosaccharide flippase family protein [Luteibacter aegosomatis]UPG84810.1 oligosaccharide flippase family protein [Luteibacter aegosomatis]